MTHSLIAIVDDDEAIRLSTCKLLEGSGFDVVAFKSGDDFLADPVSDPIACILLDLGMSGADGLQVLRALQSRGKSVPVVVVTGRGATLSAVEAKKLGASDFIEKPYDPSKLLAAIEAALAQGQKATNAPDVGEDAVARVGTLSQRETDVMRGMVRGQSNKVIAYELALSTRTVEAYRSSLLSKLGVRSAAQAVGMALAAGLGEPDQSSVAGADPTTS